MNLFNVLTIAAIPTSLDKTTKRAAALVLNLDLRADLIDIAGSQVDFDPVLPLSRDAALSLGLGLPASADIQVAGLPASLDHLLPAGRNADGSLILGMESGMVVAGVSPTKA
jgi:hypothetical protein